MTTHTCVRVLLGTAVAHDLAPPQGAGCTHSVSKMCRKHPGSRNFKAWADVGKSTGIGNSEPRITP